MPKIISLSFLILIASVANCFAQKSNDTWLRVTTGEDYFVDIDKTSLTLKEGGIISANFRTSFTSPNSTGNKINSPGRTHVDSIDFQTSSPTYRIVKDNLPEWKRRTASAILYYAAASKLAPFGSWKVLSYRYVSGEGPSKDDPEEIKSLVGNLISTRLNNLFIGRSNCIGPSFDFKSVSDKDLEQYGFTLKNLGMNSDNIKVMNVGCKTNSNYPPQTLIFLQTPAKATMLWDGVLFDIERLPNQFS